MPNHNWVDGTHLGLPGKQFRIHRVEGDPNTLLLFHQTPEVVDSPQETPQIETFQPLSIQDQLLRAIAAVTGYSQQTLQPHHDIEADLGIDSIKKKRILELLSKNFTSDQINSLENHTLLSEWISVLDTSKSVQVLPALPASEEEITELLLKITQEKTGYSRELLTLDAQLEADLGIDTIKQAQIAGQIRKMYPISFQGGLRIKDFPTLRHWLQFVIQQKALQLPLLSQAKTQDFSLTRYETVYQEHPLPDFDSNAKIPPFNFVITNDGKGMAYSLQKHLLENGAKSVAVIHEVGETLPLERTSIEAVIHLSPLGSSEDGPLQHKRFVLGSLQLARAYQKHLKLFVAVTGNSAELGIDGGIAGFVRTLSLEWPQVQTRLIGMDRNKIHTSPELLALQLYHELSSQNPAPEIFLSGKNYKIPELHVSPLNLNNPPTLELSPGSVVLISGGAGGLGLELAHELERAHGIIPILLGRSPEGNDSRYCQCDITQKDAVLQLKQRILAEYGKISGVIHAAGILEDTALETKTDSSFERVYSVKVNGMRNLAELARTAQCQFFCVFSSVSGRFGNISQCDYAAANAAMTAMVNDLRRRFPQMKSFAIAWGAWDEVGMVARTGIAEFLKANGQGTISVSEGKIAFRNELFFGGTEIETVIQSIPITNEQRESFSQFVGPNKFYFLDTFLDYSVGNHLVAKRMLDLEKDFWLKDHEILGIPILPATFGIEIMTQAALALFPDFCLDGIEDLQIHQAIRISPEKSNWIQIRAQAVAGKHSQVREVIVKIEMLVNGQFELAYQATLGVSLEPLKVGLPVLKVGEPLPTEERHLSDQDSIYQILPHGIPLGPWFHVLEEFDWDGESEAVGKVSPKKTFDHPFYSLPIAREAGFHTAALMRMKSSQEVLIPKSIGSIRNHCAPVQEAGLTVRAICKNKNSFDLFIFDSNHALCTEILDFQTLDIRELTEDWQAHGNS